MHGKMHDALDLAVVAMQLLPVAVVVEVATVAGAEFVAAAAAALVVASHDVEG